eukprot:m.65460 g.65460  ORF g.65460 m.65460 type:complete len:412 (+) comp13667_c0_seq2:619-1854(+)
MADAMVADPPQQGQQQQQQPGLAHDDPRVQYTCLACGVGFPTSDLQRKHYQTDWHRYNLKRKVASMAPVTAQAFRARVMAQKQLAEEAAQPEHFACEACNKVFSSQGAMDNHLKSKKCKENRRKYEENGPRVKAAPSNKVAAQQQEPPLDADATPMEGIVEAPTAATGDDTDPTVPPAEPKLEPGDCVFCSHKSEDLEANLKHMSSAHSFFVPDLEFVVDLPGLIQYLQMKVAEFFVCLTCNGKGREFQSLEAVRKHMVDKGHTHVDYSDQGALEIAEYYDFSSTYPDFDEEADVDGDEELTPETRAALGMTVRVDEATMDLVLPSGLRAGHRELRRYHKQRFQPEDSRDSVVIQRLMSQYKAIGLNSTMEITPAQRRSRAKAARLEQKSRMQVGVKANKLQKFFREQVLQ